MQGGCEEDPPVLHLHAIVFLVCFFPWPPWEERERERDAEAQERDSSRAGGPIV